MKILLLNPRSDTVRDIELAFSAQGMALLSTLNEQEARQMLQLHGESLTLVILHREGSGGTPVGLRINSFIKKNSHLSRLPVILTSDEWNDEQCAQHQQTPEGANAYLKGPISAPQLLALTREVLNLPALPEASSQSVAFSRSLVLEDVSEVLAKREPRDATDPSIFLEAPEGVEKTPSSPVIQNGATIPESPPAELMIPPAEFPVTSLTPESIPIIEQSQHKAAPKERASGEPQANLSLDLSGNIDSPLPPAELPSMQMDLSQQILGAPLDSAPSQLGPVEGSMSLKLPDSENLSGVSLENQDSDTNLKKVGLPSVPDSSPDLQAEAEMPYLFNKPLNAQTVSGSAGTHASSFVLVEPIGDAVIPGGAAQAPDLETIKKYLLLREQDVAVLSNQLKASKDQVAMLETLLKEEKSKNSELVHVVQEQKNKVDGFEKEKNHIVESFQIQIQDLNFQVKAKSDKVRLLEIDIREASEEMENIKERVRADIRKIRVREKELENRLEILKKDSEALVSSRENKIIELKRKIDLLEFNMDLLQDQHNREKENSKKLKERLDKAAQVVRVAEGLLDSVAAAKAKQEAS